MNRLNGLALLLVFGWMCGCQQPLERQTCRPLQVESGGVRADWYYRDRSEQPRAVQVFDSAGQLLRSTIFRYTGSLLVEHETQATGGQLLERVRLGYDASGRVSLRERWPQRSGNFDESYAREHRGYDEAGRLSQRNWQIGPEGASYTAHTEFLAYDETGRLVSSSFYIGFEMTTDRLIYRSHYEWTAIPNVLGTLWADDPTWALVDHLPARVVSFFRDGRIDSTASYEFNYQLNDRGLPVEVEKKAFRGPANQWRLKYSCR
jgi:hypothetical protein